MRKSRPDEQVKAEVRALNRRAAGLLGLIVLIGWAGWYLPRERSRVATVELVDPPQSSAIVPPAIVPHHAAPSPGADTSAAPQAQGSTGESDQPEASGTPARSDELTSGDDRRAARARSRGHRRAASDDQD